jgi:hypothetical protein
MSTAATSTKKGKRSTEKAEAKHRRLISLDLALPKKVWVMISLFSKNEKRIISAED